MYNPIATYRIQFNKDFTLTHLESLLPYLQTIGITTIYASPIFAATPESTHGYDGVDPNHINPEIGTIEQLRALTQRLHRAGMGWLQDIVPNHMAYHVNNEWLTDMLEKGPVSRFAQFFDTSLASSFFRGRIIAPFLPESMEETLAQGKLTLAYEQDRLVFKIGGNTLPLKPGSYEAVLQANIVEANDAVRQLLTVLSPLRQLDEPEAYTLAWDEFREQLTSLVNTPQTGQYVADCVKAINGDSATLRRLADEQHYRFCTEPETRLAINYRRFFAVNSLICLNMGDELVFEKVHSLTKELIDEDVFQGLRVDHVDGLFDPAQYLKRLRELTGKDTYVVVEKILQATERLPESWPVQGTSGYDFLAIVNNVLTDGRSESIFREFYQGLIGSDTSLSKRIRDRKAYFLAQFMGGELDNLYQYFLSLNLADEVNLETLAAGELKLAIGELLIECPVYRYYGNQFPMPDDEAKVIRNLLKTVKENSPNLAMAVRVLDGALLTKPPVADKDYNQRALRFYQRLMQFSSPLMAKGVEDTLLYTYNCFIGHNEVGDSPERFGISVDAFHRAMEDRQKHWPLAQNTTATHDTKRGEDVRARLNVLTDLADEWLTEVQHWQELNRSLIPKDESEVDSPGETTETADRPDLNDEYFIYQNLLGAYPMPGQDEDDFPNRFHIYLEKALQEAKRHTIGWVVDDTYQEGVRRFTEQLLDQKSAFWKRFQVFHRSIADFGIVNSLTQTLLKFTCPGVPDIYQGGEGWDLSLVDPDNRRPVDFATRQEWLADGMAHQQAGESFWAELWQHRFDGRIKFWLTRTLLQERQQNATLFLKGDYVPLAVHGTYHDHVLAFARQHELAWYVVVVPLYAAQLCRQQNQDVVSIDWKDTHVLLPNNAPSAWTNQLSGLTGDEGHSVAVKRVLTTLPVALLRLG
ncbi:malto-oligosyltrehalose synthase [Spirosoma sp. BT704]|uniref:Malto-oligosyltrehalose synthase n=2 Tax=Spirosoma validum TaxID=2771355 RepID=A0A927GG14_9BACT|nr:malto-oligosyltrehalose synthase [Spirosoma validum]